MNFIHSLPLDVKLLIGAMVGCALLALFSSNHKAEKRYMVVLAVLAFTGVYRYVDRPVVETVVVPAEQEQQAITTTSARKPIVSTSAK
jgi:hypothetical protein